MIPSPSWRPGCALTPLLSVQPRGSTVPSCSTRHPLCNRPSRVPFIRRETCLPCQPPPPTPACSPLAGPIMLLVPQDRNFLGREENRVHWGKPWVFPLYFFIPSTFVVLMSQSISQRESSLSDSATLCPPSASPVLLAFGDVGVPWGSALGPTPCDAVMVKGCFSAASALPLSPALCCIHLHMPSHSLLAGALPSFPRPHVPARA